MEPLLNGLIELYANDPQPEALSRALRLSNSRDRVSGYGRPDAGAGRARLRISISQRKNPRAAGPGVCVICRVVLRDYAPACRFGGVRRSGSCSRLFIAV